MAPVEQTWSLARVRVPMIHPSLEYEAQLAPIAGGVSGLARWRILVALDHSALAEEVA